MTVRAERGPGRPGLGALAKTAPISLRVEPAFRREIERAAHRNNRSISQEVETRLRASFGDTVPDSDALTVDMMRRVVREELRSLAGEGQK